MNRSGVGLRICIPDKFLMMLTLIQRPALGTTALDDPGNGVLRQGCQSDAVFSILPPRPHPPGPPHTHSTAQDMEAQRWQVSNPSHTGSQGQSWEWSPELLSPGAGLAAGQRGCQAGVGQ